MPHTTSGYLLWIWAGGALFHAAFFYHQCPPRLSNVGKLLHGIVGGAVALCWPLMILMALAWVLRTALRKEK